MNKIKLIGIDLAKRCYQVCAVGEHNKVLYNRKYTAKKFAEAIAQLEPTTIAMEACAASHYWGRRLQAAGHHVLLVPPQHAKAFRRVHKSDEHDALSIVEAAQRPNIHFVPVKTITQQDLQMLGGLRERCVAQAAPPSSTRLEASRASTGSTFRPHGRRSCANYPQRWSRRTTTSHRSRAPAWLRCSTRSSTWVSVSDDLLYRMTELAGEDPAHRRLQTIPGVGPVLAPIVLAKLGHAQQFKSGHDCAAWVGLVPKQMSTGGKTSLGGISKNGDRMLRTLLIHGARAVIRWASKHDHAQSRWIKQLVTRVGTNKAVVALANKTMRMIWAVLTQGTTFDMHKAYRPQAPR